MTKPVSKDQAPRYRMRDLCQETGLSRQAIHFYIQQGLLPEGQKTGRNMAYYGPQHLERLQIIRRLQDEHFLPLKAIRALFDGELEGFSEPQRQLFRELKPHMKSLLANHAGEEWVGRAEILASINLPDEDFVRLTDLGFITTRIHGEETQVAAADVQFLEIYAKLRDIGFAETLGFGPDDLRIYEEAFNAMFEKERDLVVNRMIHMPPQQIAPMLEEALPIIHEFFVRYHRRLIRNFFAKVL